MAGLKTILGEGIEHGVKNLKAVKGGGEYLEAAVKGALGMGAIGGVTEWSQGGSFWSGAKGNIISGAALGVGVRGANVAINGGQWDKTGFSGSMNKVKSGYKSKQLKVLEDLEANAKKVL